MVYNWLKIAQKLAYPYTCVVCQGSAFSDLDLCDDCKAALPRLAAACRQCALPLPTAGIELCGKCLASPPDFHESHVPFHYSEPVDRLIQGLKFNARLSYGRVLGELMSDFLREGCIELPDCIIPVPLHAKRIRERGFNQSLILAQHISQSLKLRVDYRSVSRIRHTIAQMELPAKARQKNIRGAFAVDKDFAASHVALLDDVMTTGSTMRELAKVLTKAGVLRIQVWSCARA